MKKDNGSIITVAQQVRQFGGKEYWKAVDEMIKQNMPPLRLNTLEQLEEEDKYVRDHMEEGITFFEYIFDAIEKIRIFPYDSEYVARKVVSRTYWTRYRIHEDWFRKVEEELKPKMKYFDTLYDEEVEPERLDVTTRKVKVIQSDYDDIRDGADPFILKRNSVSIYD